MACASQSAACYFCKKQFKSEVWCFFGAMVNGALSLVVDQA
jgi:hypothetical protein